MRVRGSIFLAAAFAALLLVIGGSALAVWRNATISQRNVGELHNNHVQAGAALAAIRANVYLTGILTRDYLLDPDPANVQQYIDQFAAIRKNTEQSFGVLKFSGQDPQQRAAIDRLNEEIDAYWDPTEIALDWTPEEKRASRAQLLRQRVRRRQDVFALTSQVEILMTENYTRERARITTAEREFRKSLGWITGIAMVFGIAIAAATLHRMIALQNQSEAAESELRRLSGQLRTTQEQERKYLSRELHDQVGQMLTGVRMELASIARRHGEAESEFSAEIAHAKGTVEQTLRIVRNIAMLIRPSMLDDLGLSPALAWLVKDVSRSSGIEIRSSVDAAVDALPDGHRTCIYRVVQEALTNCSRHSQARHVDISVQAHGDSVDAVIADDGRGFDSAGAKHRGLGLLGMEERVRELGGKFRVISSVGHGARIEIHLPIPGATETKDDSHSDRGRSRDRSDRVETSA